MIGSNDDSVSHVSAGVFTLALSVICAAAIACGCPWGLSSQGVGVEFVAFVWIALCVSIPMGLAAWAMLREQHRVLRFVVPVSLLMLLIGAKTYGERWNYMHVKGSDAGLTSADTIAMFIVACLVFGVVRASFGWRLGPVYEGDHQLRLWHLFLWTTVAAFSFAVIAWARVAAGDFLPNGRIVGSVVIGFFGGLITISCVGFVFDDPTKRIRYLAVWGLVFLPVFVMVLAMLAYQENQLSLLLLPTVLIGFLVWSFRCYRSFGYAFVSPNQAKETTADRFSGLVWLLPIIGLLLLAIYAPFAVNVLSFERGRRAFEDSWAPRGVFPTSSEGPAVTGVLFRAGQMELTHQAADELEGQPLRFVGIWNQTPEAGSLKKIVSAPTVERVQIKGNKFTKAHLKELYEAQHLKDVELSNVPLLTPADIAALRKALPNCEIVFQ